MNVIYTGLLVLLAVCYAYGGECPKGTGEDTYAYKKYTGVTGEVEMDLKRGSAKTPPVIGVKISGGKVKVQAEVDGAKKSFGTSKASDNNLHFDEPVHTDKLFFTPEGTDSFEVLVNVCY